MPTLDVITRGIGIENPDLMQVIRHLEAKALPVARSKKTLQTIAPAVSVLHGRMDGLITAMSGKDSDKTRLKRNINFAFRRITDMYVILCGIEPLLKNDDAVAHLIKERAFAREILAITWDVFVEAGGGPDPKWEALPILPSRQKFWKEKLKKLKKDNPLPDFASKANMKKGTVVTSGIVVLFFILYFLIDSGILFGVFREIFGD